MSVYTWNGDKFCSDLTSRLTASLACVSDTAALARAVTDSAATAEAACSGREMACTAGCPHCCVLNVAVLLPEAMLIAEWMREKLSEPELQAMHKRLRLHRCWTRWMDDEERIAKHMTCPMLDAAGCCMIHPVRPLACRGVTSLDRDSCRAALAPGITDEVRLVPADLLRRAAFDEGFKAVGEALRFHGLDDRSIELGTGVLAFLECPEYQDLVVRGEKLPNALWL